MTQAFPLRWHQSKPRSKHTERSRFDTSFRSARDGLVAELERLGARNVVLSTNIETRLDGLPYANRPDPKDSGVAVYFEYKSKPMCFACDKWDRVCDNLHAIAKTITAIRGIERWGSKDMLKAAFAGFEALPPPQQSKWWMVLGLRENASPEEVKSRYRELIKIHHPDHGGSRHQFDEIQQAYQEAM